MTINKAIILIVLSICAGFGLSWLVSIKVPDAAIESSKELLRLDIQLKKLEILKLSGQCKVTK